MNKPTTFKLALIAAQLGPKAGEERKAINQAMALWAEAERELEQVDQRCEYLRDMISKIYDDTPAEWKERVAGYPGRTSDVDAALMKRVPAEEVHKRLWRNKNFTKLNRAVFFVGLAKVARSHNLPAPPAVFKTARPVTSDPSEPYYDAGTTRHEIREVISKSGQWPKERTFSQPGKPLTAEEISLEKKRVELEFENIRQRLSAESLTLHTVRWAVEVRQQQLAASKTRYVPQSLKGRRMQ